MSIILSNSLFNNNYFPVIGDNSLQILKPEISNQNYLC